MIKKKNSNLIIEDIPRDERNLWAKFHEATSINILTENNTKNWPQEWTEINFKSYPRLKKVILDKPFKFNGELSSSILSRKSQRSFNNYKISKQELSNLFYFSVGIINQRITSWNSTNRAYPSAGARYPLETYALVINSRELDQGLYHYNIKLHCLELLLTGNVEKVLSVYINQQWVKKSSVIFFITSVVGRSGIKYGDRAYRHCLLEAGHIGQNLYLVSETVGLKCCAIGGFLDQEINKLLDLDPQVEVTLYILAIGK